MFASPYLINSTLGLNVVSAGSQLLSLVGALLFPCSCDRKRVLAVVFFDIIGNVDIPLPPFHCRAYLRYLLSFLSLLENIDDLHLTGSTAHPVETCEAVIEAFVAFRPVAAAITGDLVQHFI